jgi:hypothetical protein
MADADSTSSEDENINQQSERAHHSTAGSKRKTTTRSSKRSGPKRKKYDEKRRALEDHETFREEADTRRHGGPILNWNTLANRNWGSVSVLRYAPHQEVDKLVGWATHITSNSRPLETLAAEAGFANVNPLLHDGHSTGPLPPSHLNYLKEKARDMVRGKIVFPPSASRTGNEESPFKSIAGTFDASACVALGKVLQDMITANLLPLAEHHVHRCRRLEQQEELEGEDRVKERRGQMEDCSFHGWVLPPEEAIYKIMTCVLSESNNNASANDQHKGSVSLNDSLDPQTSKTCWAGRGLLSTQPPTRVNPEHSVAEPKEISVVWCQRQKLEANFVRRNMEVYDLFLPCPPPEARRKQRGGIKAKKT